jgi:hypothetical protein
MKTGESLYVRSVEVLKQLATIGRRGVAKMKKRDRLLPGRDSRLGRFCGELILRLEAHDTWGAPENEHALETVVVRIVDEMAKAEWLDVRRHPWGCREYELGWAEVKELHCADAPPTRHSI